MRPVRLQLEGFGAFRDATEIDFDDIELVALVGRTGSGKSTIIDAITFALYGSVARYDDNRAVAPVINQTSTRARVRLDFDLAGERYTAVRLVQRRGTGATTKEARLELGDEVLAADARTMTTAIERLLGLDAAQFNRTVVLPQGRFADFLHDNPADRQKTLRGLLGLDIYQVVATEARRRAATLRTTADALRPDLDAAADLSDERRAELLARHAAITRARETFIVTVDELTAAHALLGPLDERIAAADRDLQLLATVDVPDGLAKIDDRLARAAAALATTEAALATARTRRQNADAAVAAGPDVATVTAQLGVHRQADQATADHAATAALLAAAQLRLAATQTAAEAVERAQATLDAAAASARGVERQIREQAADGPQPAQLEHWITLRERRESASAAVVDATNATATTAATIDPLRAEVSSADATEASARTEHDELRQRAGAAGLMTLLRTGEPCPLCRHVVDEIPDHHIDDDLARAAERLDAAVAEATARRNRLATAERALADLTASLGAEQRTLDALDADLAGAPALDELRGLLQASEAQRTAVQHAAADVRRAEETADAHRGDRAHADALQAAIDATADTARLRGLEDAQRSRRDDLATQRATLPAAAELTIAIETAGRLADEQRAAAAALADAEHAHDAAVAAQRAAATAVAAATDQLRAARDRLAALGPPSIDTSAVAAGWTSLADWAAKQHRAVDAARDGVVTERDAQRAECKRLEDAARAICAAAIGVSTGDRVALRDQLAQAETTAAAAITTFDVERERLQALIARIEGIDADRAVADQLGQLLRADAFEGWLMEAALGELIAAASERLRELSSGQFSLELVEREFMVRDHGNADELRSARTLSGGETFLASLSLALALSDATSELAADGSPTLQSIFLDEGFGSLDPATLDVVAGAIEELGSTGRMVAVVTHIRELADRMPVRFEVAKVGSSSTVARVDA